MTAIEGSQTTTTNTTTTNSSSRITTESILQDVIDDINKLENRVKSAKSLVDLLVLHRDMTLELTAISLQLDVFRSMLQYEGVLPKDSTFTLEDLDK